MFKIGEYSYYGKWRITINHEGWVYVTGIDWYTGKIMEEKEFGMLPFGKNELWRYLSEISTSGWADIMIEWVEKTWKDMLGA